MGHRRYAKMLYDAAFVPARSVHNDEIEMYECLGGGNEGIVYRGSLSGREVAVKKSHGKAEALLREAVVMKKCQSPYLLPLVAVVEGANAALVLEIMDGGDLRTYLNNLRDGAPVAVKYSTLEVAWVIANAIADLHHAGLLHRDLKSNNVLLSSTHYIKVADQGIAKENATLNTQCVGTVNWMAPEVIVADSAYSYAADIYSFGVILTELDTLEVPFAGLSHYLTMSKPNSCMAHDPAQRPSANDVVRLLQRQRRRLERTLTTATPPVPLNLPTDGSTAAVLINTAIACIVCGASLSLEHSACPSCARPAPSDATKLEILLHRIEASEADIKTTMNCSVCGAPGPIQQEMCPFPGCGERSPSATDKIKTLSAYNGREGVVRQLIAAGANVNHKGNDQFTSLIYAAVKGHVTCARRLLAAGADVNAANKSMNTARDIAKGYNNSNVLRALDEVQPSGLVRAAEEGYLMRVRHLLATGSDVNKPDSDGSLLNIARRRGHGFVDLKMAPVKVMSEVMAGRLRPSLRADCPTWLRELATACMAHNPKERPSAREIIKLLQRQRKEPADTSMPPLSATATPANPPLSSRHASTTTLSGSGTESFSALSTASLVASTINCANCSSPQTFLTPQCSKCATPAKSTAVKLKVLCARLTTAKKRGINIRVPCFVCSSPNDPTTDTCGECQFITPASDDERLRLLVAILDHDRGADVRAKTFSVRPTHRRVVHCVQDVANGH
ncbi:protein kinase [Achlya hypogyna]|uniref:Protein kinase n=1 Tax=Achlya hypogyna TaxID=1202772 RepID=A0A1V9YIZ0_ACHHY|nr:protein kinase [Achlya hypogyna]